jgi:hypothetical protein
MLNLHEIGWYYKWTLVMPSILHHEQPFVKSYGLLPVPWINFSICLMILCMPILIIFIASFLT